MEIGEQTGWEESQPKLSTHENAIGKSLLCKPLKERKKEKMRVWKEKSGVNSTIALAEDLGLVHQAPYSHR